MPYDHKQMEEKWQKRYEADQPFRATDDLSKKKFYPLVEFPFPSGAGLHVGHPRSYTALDVVARKKRMEGLNVLYPMGWDAFGLPTENYALKTGIPPADVTRENTDTFRRQLKAIGFSFDWSREVNTTDPAYYKWTQWMFLEFFKAGLAYKAKMAINWCPKDKIGLANEEAVGGVCDRCGGPVEKREKEQWMIAITKYADRLLEDLKTVNYLPKIKKQQEDWIGRSEGAEIDFALNFTFTPEANANRGPNGEKAQLTVFTTRPDTLFGVTYLVLAPEHPWVQLATDDDHHVLENKEEVRAYVEAVKSRPDTERTNDDKEKTGVELKGVKAINPANGEEVAIWAADYVLPQYGTGAVMAVPAHDERDFAFAKKYQLPVKQVVVPCADDPSNPPREGFEEVKRDTVIVHLRDRSTGKFALLDWHGSLEGITTAIMGGVEAGQTPEEAALAEISEEASLQGVSIVKSARWITAARYCASHKQQNRCAHSWGFLAEVESLQNQGEIAQTEQALHTLVWVDEAEVASRLTPVHQKLVWDLLNHDEAVTDAGYLINSGEFDGVNSKEAGKAIAQKFGRTKVTYKLRDWVFSRQRYWGEPIPLVHCEKDGWVALPESELPLTLPNIGKYEASETGESPLATIPDWVNTKCPQCAGPAVRETDTMPNWAGSSWYFLRYIDPHNDQQFASPEKLAYWMPVDLYNGGMEHTTLHLLYSRFWYKFLFDRGHIPASCGSEPYARRHSHGLIMAEDGAKMSKSKGNVVNPDEVVAEFGADVFRMYMLFIGPFEEPAPWQKNGLIGVRRFLEKTLRLAEAPVASESAAVTRQLHKTIAKVTEDIENFRFNTAVAAFMTFGNVVQEEGGMSADSWKVFARLIAPLAPHLANEIWEKGGETGLVDLAPWPVADAAYLVDEEATIAVQFNGKSRGSVTVPASAGEGNVLSAVRADEALSRYFTGEPKKIIFVPGRIINILV